MANSAPVVGAVVDQVENDLLASQHPFRSVHERETDAVISLIRAERVGIVLQPLIRRREATIEFFQLRQFPGVRGSMWVGRRNQSRSEELFYPNHVVQLLKGEREDRWMERSIDLGGGIQRPPVRPSLVLQWLVKEHETGDDRLRHERRAARRWKAFSRLGRIE